MIEVKSNPETALHRVPAWLNDFAEEDRVRFRTMAANTGTVTPDDVDWEKLRSEECPAELVIMALLALWDPLDDDTLAGWGPGEVDAILAARKIVTKYRNK